MTDLTAVWQLPDGVDELLPPTAWRVEQLRRQFTDSCHRSGYELVMPPLIEYIDALLTGTGESTSLQTFKVVDQQSGRTLGIRADMTPQVARIDAHALRSDAPSRLFYTGTVVRARTDGFGGSRTPWQYGAELFGHAGAAADIEIIRLMLDTAKLAGLSNEDLVLDLGHVGVYQGLCKAAELDDSQQDAVFTAMTRGSLPDTHAALMSANCSEVIFDALCGLLQLQGGEEVLDRAQDLVGAADGICTALQTLKEVVSAVQQSHPGVRLVIDLAELRGYRYHTGMLFAAYTSAGDVIARGGRYDAIGKAFGRDRPATGFSGDLIELTRLAAAQQPQSNNDSIKGVFVPAIENLTDQQLSARWEMIMNLRTSGERVVLALPADGSTAASLHCNHQLLERDGQWCVERNN